MAENKRELTVSVGVDVADAIKALKAVQREAKEATRALKELEASEKETYAHRLSVANEMLSVQGAQGNFDYDQYMHGMYNGMEYIVSLMEARDPAYLDSPKEFIAPHCDVTTLTTERLQRELENREGVVTHQVSPQGEKATIHIDYGNHGEAIPVDGPAIITINKD